MTAGRAAGGGAPCAPYVRRAAVMGTGVTFVVHPGGTPTGSATGTAGPDRAGAVERALAWLRWVDRTFTTYSPDSEISRLDAGRAGIADCHPEVRAVLDLCSQLHRDTGGWFDARATGRLDPSGVVKGWAVERASALLEESGFPNHQIECGGDVRLRGRPAGGGDWRVAVVHPLRLDAYSAVLRVAGGAVATSGTYERGFHVFDPFRRRPALALASVTVVGADLTTADAYATTAMAMGPAAPAWLSTVAGFEAMLVDHDGRGWTTPGFSRLAGAQTGPLTHGCSSP
jgi:thiamine biosynthesis lipoprotein